MLVVTAATALFFNTAAAESEPKFDLRNLRVGMSVRDLPLRGYVMISCAEDLGQQLTGWTEYFRCSRDDDGLHRLHFEFDEASNVLSPLDDKYGGTMVAGHPVVLSLDIDSDERVVGLSIRTDDKARLNQRKKAFLLGPQAKGFFGNDGWSCAREMPTDDEAPVGDVFIKESCRKSLEGREVVIQRAFYRPLQADIKNLVSMTTIDVRLDRHTLSRPRGKQPERPLP